MELEKHLTGETFRSIIMDGSMLRKIFRYSKDPLPLYNTKSNLPFQYKTGKWL